MPNGSRVYERIWGGCLVAAPVLGGVPAFLLDAEGRYGVAGGTITALTSVLWIYGLAGFFGVIRSSRPVFAPVALLVAIVGAGLGGMSFGFQGFFEGVFGISKHESLGSLADYPVAANLLLWIPGPLFPVALLLVAVAICLTRIAPRWTAVLICLSAVVFPLSRISRVEWVLHSASILMIVPFAYLGWLAVNGRITPFDTRGDVQPGTDGPSPVAHPK